jgi:hypothetical protein
MDKVAETPTREPDAFETQALLVIQRRQELYTNADGNLIRMMAPIFATPNCVRCHEPQGKLLGVFSYEVERGTVPAGSGS